MPYELSSETETARATSNGGPPMLMATYLVIQHQFRSLRYICQPCTGSWTNRQLLQR